MSKPDPFFVAPKAAAALKHGVLKQYLPPFMTKVASRSEGGQVVVLDGYAGKGRYDDDSPGSPAVILDAARVLQSRGKDPLCVFVEPHDGNLARLTQLLEEEAGDVRTHVLSGVIEEHLDEVLAMAKGVPLFAFLDPYGLSLPYGTMVELFTQRPYTPTEMLLNFSCEAIWRHGGLLTSDAVNPAKAKQLANIDAVCGGDWWREIYLQAATSEAATQAIAQGLCQRLCKELRAAGWTIEVRKQEGHQPVYDLVHITRHRHGMMLMGTASSLAQADWRRACAVGTLLEDDTAFAAQEEAIFAGHVATVGANVESLLKAKATIDYVADYSAIFAGVEGEARFTHLTKALKPMVAAGLIRKEKTGNNEWDYRLIRLDPSVE